MTIRPDITTTKDADGFSLRPHSAAGNAFLEAEFASYGDADLTAFDVDCIQEKAARAGLNVFNSLGQFIGAKGSR